MRTWIYGQETAAGSPEHYMTDSSLEKLKSKLANYTEFSPGDLDDRHDDEKEGWNEVLAAKAKGVKKEDLRVVASTWRSKKRRLLSRIRIVRFLELANQAVEPERWTGPYAWFKSHPKQLYGMIICLYMLGWDNANSCLRYIDSPDDILAYALDYFTVSQEVEKRMVKQKQAGKHVVINGHGCYHSKAGTLTVPAGKFIHFYTSQANYLRMDTSQKIEGASGGRPFLIPLETFEAGETIEHYFLGYPAGLTLNVSGWNGGLGDMVINKDKDRMVSLATLLKQPKLQAATHIHWCACRQNATGECDVTWPGPWLEQKKEGVGQTGTKFGKNGFVTPQAKIPSLQGS